MTFLASNGLEPTLSDATLVSLTLSTAEGKRSKSAIAEFLRAHTRPAGPSKRSRKRP